MQTAIEFSLQQLMNRAVAVDPAFASKYFGNHFNPKMGFARCPSRAWPGHGVGVTRMFVRFVDDFDKIRGKGCLQFCFDTVAGSHVTLRAHVKNLS